MIDVSFIERMESELFTNQHKGDWAIWYPNEMHLLAEILHHTAKLTHALNNGQKDSVSEHAADLANLAMKTHSLYGSKG